MTLPPTPTLPKAAQSGTASVNGIRIWYAEFGRGEPVILLHGGLANANYWGNQVPALAKRYRVIVMDSRGHGRSTRDAQPFGYDLMASDVLALMDSLENPQGRDRRLERRRDPGPRHRHPSSRAADEAVRVRRQFRPERRRRHRQEPGFQRLYRARREGIRKFVADADATTSPSSTRSARCGRPSRTSPPSSSAPSRFRPGSSTPTTTRRSSARTPSSWRASIPEAGLLLAARGQPLLVPAGPGAVHPGRAPLPGARQSALDLRRGDAVRPSTTPLRGSAQDEVKFLLILSGAKRSRRTHGGFAWTDGVDAPQRYLVGRRMVRHICATGLLS